MHTKNYKVLLTFCPEHVMIFFLYRINAMYHDPWQSIFLFPTVPNDLSFVSLGYLKCDGSSILMQGDQGLI